MFYKDLEKYREELCMSGENWRDVKGWEGLYSVSDIGRVKRESWGLLRYNQPKILKPISANGRYLKVVLTAKHLGRGKSTRSVHRLVAEAFMPNPEFKPQVNHINADIFDNDLDNLEWCTASENIKHSFKLGRKSVSKGEACNFSKYSEATVKAVYKEAIRESAHQGEIAKKYGIPYSVVSSIKTKRTWKHITDLIDTEIH